MIDLGDLPIGPIESAEELMERALLVATVAHQGQWRYDPRQPKGTKTEPYVFHPVRVASKVQGAVAKAAALLHDTIEDCDDVDDELLSSMGFPDVVVETVATLTQDKRAGERSRKGERYFDYIRRVAQHPVARWIKLADLADNMQDQPPHATILDRYMRATRIITGAANQGECDIPSLVLSRFPRILRASAETYIAEHQGGE